MRGLCRTCMRMREIEDEEWRRVEVKRREEEDEAKGKGEVEAG